MKIPDVKLTVSNDGPLFTTVCPHCGEKITAVIRLCDGTNRVTICSCGNSVLAVSRTESPQTVLSRAVQTLACDGKILEALCQKVRATDGWTTLPYALAWVPQPEKKEYVMMLG